MVVEEKQDTWQRNRPEMQFLDDGRRFLWETEKTGWKHWELRDLDGSLINPLTSGEYPVESVVKLDEDAVGSTTRPTVPKLRSTRSCTG